MNKIYNITDLAEYLGCDPTESGISRRVYKDTECGAWFKLINTPAVLIGSIVEGSDAEISPERLSFPFTIEDWERAIKTIEDDADRLWHEENNEK